MHPIMTNSAIKRMYMLGANIKRKNGDLAGKSEIEKMVVCCLPERVKMMMNPIFLRRSIRSFIDKPVEREKLERIAKAGQLAPSAMGRFPWEILIATSPEAKQMISQMSPYSKMAARAGAVIIVCADMQKAIAGQAWWIQDCAACTENILLQIVAEGMGGVWLGTYPKQECMKKISEFFMLPDHIIPFSTIALGYSKEENIAKDRYDPAKVHFERF